MAAEVFEPGMGPLVSATGRLVVLLCLANLSQDKIRLAAENRSFELIQSFQRVAAQAQRLGVLSQLQMKAGLQEFAEHRLALQRCGGEGGESGLAKMPGRADRYSSLYNI